MSKKNQPLIPIGLPVQALLKQLGLETKMREHALARKWEEIVGPVIASHTCPSSIKFRKLYLSVDSSVWMQELSFKKEELIQMINKAMGGDVIREIRFRIGPVHEEG